MFQYII